MIPINDPVPERSPFHVTMGSLAESLEIVSNLEESEWLRVTLHKWLDDEYCPEPTNVDINNVAARSYYKSLMENQTDLGDILLRMAMELETISFKESFHVAFSSANAAICSPTSRKLQGGQPQNETCVAFMAPWQGARVQWKFQIPHAFVHPGDKKVMETDAMVPSNDSINHGALGTHVNIYMARTKIAR
ncbi:hypothetical protein Tco_0815426 [Tanacetum coccineum]